MQQFTWLLFCLVVVVITQNVATRQPSHGLQQQRRHQQQQQQKHRKQHKKHMATLNNDNVDGEAELEPDDPEQYNGATLNIEAELAVDTTLQCPVGCACQYAHFMDLPISRWINYVQSGQQTKASSSSAASSPTAAETAEQLINDNETAYEGDESFLQNPFIKQATCILQADVDAQALINSLPHDLQALILLYTGIGQNKTVASSVLKPLNQLTTLEIRGSEDGIFKLLIDEPLEFLQHVNFEYIELIGSDNPKRPKHELHPRDTFDYKPKMDADIYATGDGDETLNEAYKLDLNFEQAYALDEIEILPYDVYMQEVKRARMPSFFGWQRLEVLRIHSCQLHELHYPMFDGLDTLQHLSLERNAIEVVSAFALFGAYNIRTLSLAHNAIHDLHYRALAGLLALESLDLSDNRLGLLSEMSFPPFPKLVFADFRQNPIHYILPATFGVMNNTRTLLFGSAQLPMELLNNEPFQRLALLRELSLQNVAVGILERNIFQGLNSLEILKVKGSIRRIEYDAFADQTQLRVLDLSDCQLQEISMDALMGCKQLEIVNLARNNLTHIPPGLFDEQHKLEEIYLEGNQLRRLPATFFDQPRLSLARLTDNPWQCSCEMQMWRAKTTNQRRNGARTLRCITDYTTRKQLRCRKVANYQFEHKLAPRCDNYNGRSVYYVLRKQLQCGDGRIVVQKRQKSGRAVGERLGQRMQKLRLLELQQKADNEKQQQSNLKSNQRMTWQIQRQEKIRRTLARENSIEHVLLQQQQQQEHEQQLKMLRQLAVTVETVAVDNNEVKDDDDDDKQPPQIDAEQDEISNDIF